MCTLRHIPRLRGLVPMAQFIDDDTPGQSALFSYANFLMRKLAKAHISD